MYCILLDDQVVYAATDSGRFFRELIEYAAVSNATWELRKPLAGAHS